MIIERMRSPNATAKSEVDVRKSAAAIARDQTGFTGTAALRYRVRPSNSFTLPDDRLREAASLRVGSLMRTEMIFSSRSLK
jgi:hypothetical protein